MLSMPFKGVRGFQPQDMPLVDLLKAVEDFSLSRLFHEQFYVFRMAVSGTTALRLNSIKYLFYCIDFKTLLLRHDILLQTLWNFSIQNHEHVFSAGYSSPLASSPALVDLSLSFGFRATTSSA